MTPMDWKKYLGLSETPLQRSSPATPPVSPGSPGQATGKETPIKIVGPTDISVIKYANRFRRKLGLAAASGFDGYITDLLPALVMSAVELEDYFPDDLLMVGMPGIVQNAAHTSVCWLRNPTKSGLLVTLLGGTICRLNTAGVVFLRILNPPAADTANIAALQPRDLRIATGGAAFGATTVHTDQDNTGGAPGGTTIWQGFTGASVNPDQVPPMVIPQGWDLGFFPDIPNEGLRATFLVRIQPYSG
jgi:hypothetical protein